MEEMTPKISQKQIDRFYRLLLPGVTSWGETEVLGYDSPVTFLPPARPCEMVIILTKLSGLLGEVICDHPPDVAIVSKIGRIDRHTVAMIRSLTSRRRCSMRFVGDLDALDLVNYLQAVVVCEGVGRQLQYTGINDLWLKTCRRFLAEPIPTASDTLPVIRMHPDEADFVSMLMDGVPKLKETVGIHATNLLLRGFKFELEGASNPSLYRKGFETQLRRILFAGP